MDPIWGAVRRGSRSAAGGRQAVLAPIRRFFAGVDAARSGLHRVAAARDVPDVALPPGNAAMPARSGPRHSPRKTAGRSRGRRSHRGLRPAQLSPRGAVPWQRNGPSQRRGTFSGHHAAISALLHPHRCRASPWPGPDSLPWPWAGCRGGPAADRRGSTPIDRVAGGKFPYTFRSFGRISSRVGSADCALPATGRGGAPLRKHMRLQPVAVTGMTSSTY